MTIPTHQAGEDRKWYGLALRHLRIASRLHRAGFLDGAVFHAYHAYECVLSAFIANSGYPVPPEGWTKLKLPSGKTRWVYPSPSGYITERSAHKARIIFFDELANRTKPYCQTHARLKRFITFDDRLNALYYDASTDTLPYERYQSAIVQGLLLEVHQFAWDVRREI